MDDLRWTDLNIFAEGRLPVEKEEKKTELRDYR